MEPMLNEFQAKLRAERIVRPVTLKERGLAIAGWSTFATGVVIWICLSPLFSQKALESFLLLIAVVGIRNAVRTCETTEITAQGRDEILEARRKDREILRRNVRVLVTSWFGRLVAAGIVFLACYLYASHAATLSGDEKLLLGLVLLGAALWAWQTSLALLAIAVLWWLSQLNWHVSTPAAVIIGAIIIAIALGSKK